MTMTTRAPVESPVAEPLRRFSYLIAIGANLVMLFVANNILEWDFLPFLTAEFGRLVWIINLSLAATILVNLVYLGYDPPWFRSTSQIGLNAISLGVGARMLQVFPFDFSGYEFNWELTVRLIVILTIVGLVVATIVELGRLMRMALDRNI